MNASGKSVFALGKLRFIEPMYALAVQNIPEGKEWLYELKFDGYRCLAGRDKNGVTLWSRRGNLFTSQFPRIARACEPLPVNTLLDGEIIAIDKSGRISFNLLQHHRSHAQALLFYAFDVIVCLAIYFGTSESLAALPQTCRYTDGRPGETRHDLTVRAIGPRRVAHERSHLGPHTMPYRSTRSAHETQGTPARWQ